MQLLILLPILSQLIYVTKPERISHELIANYTCLGSFQSKLAANSNAVAHIIAYFETTFYVTKEERVSHELVA